MKKRTIIFSIFFLLIGIITLTFALPSMFTINKINFMQDLKINEIMKHLDSRYYIEEPKLVVSENEKTIIDKAISATTVVVGLPNKKLDHSYWAYKSRLQKLQEEYGYNNEDLLNNSRYSYAIIDKSKYYNKSNQFAYSFKEIEEKQLQTYKKIIVKGIRSYYVGEYTVNLIIDGAEFLEVSPKTGEFEKTKGTVDVSITIIEGKNDFKVLNISMYVNSNVEIDYSTIEKIELSSLSDEISYNTFIDKECTADEIEQINQIYQNNKNSIVSLTTIGKNNTVLSNATGFFLDKGIIITNWDWFEKYLIGDDNLIVSDINNNIYYIDGIISISKYYDIVILKLTEEVGVPISEQKSTYVAEQELIIALTSPLGVGISTNIGLYLSNSVVDVFKMQLPLTNGEVGSPVFNKDGKLMGITNSLKTNSNVSYATSFFYLNMTLFTLSYDEFDTINVYKLSDIKKEMYFNKVSNFSTTLDNYDEKIYIQYMDGIDIKDIYTESISKITTIDDRLIIRVNYSEKSLISKKQYSNLYAIMLLEQGYKEFYSDEYKRIFKNDKYSITFAFETGYISIIYREV